MTAPKEASQTETHEKRVIDVLSKYIDPSRSTNDVCWSLAKAFLEPGEKSVPSLSVIVVKRSVDRADVVSASELLLSRTTHPSRRTAEADGYISCRELKTVMGTLADMLFW